MKSLQIMLSLLESTHKCAAKYANVPLPRFYSNMVLMAQMQLNENSLSRLNEEKSEFKVVFRLKIAFRAHLLIKYRVTSYTWPCVSGTL